MILLVGPGCSDSDQATEPVQLPAPSTASAVVTEVPGWVGGTTEVYVADLDADERLDLVLTSHAKNRVQPFRQQPTGLFTPLPPLEGVGFHPNGVAAFQDEKGRSFLLQNAETRNQLRIYRLKGQRIIFHDAVDAPKPLLTVPLDNAGRPGSLLMLSRGNSSITVYRGFDPKTASYIDQTTLWRPEATQAGRVRSPILARLAPGANAEPIFIDTVARGLRVLRFGADGKPFMDDLYMAEPEFRPALVRAGQSAPDAPQPLFLAGTNDAPLRLLIPDPGTDSEFAVRDVPLLVDYNQDLAVIDDADQPPLVVISRQQSLLFLRFETGLDARPVWSAIKKHPRVGQVIMTTADVDADGHTDLALANSGNLDIPPLILHGPIWEHAAALTDYYTDVARFEPIVRPRGRGQGSSSDMPRTPKMPSIPGIPNMLDPTPNR